MCWSVAVVTVAVTFSMGGHTYEEDPVTSPLGGVEPGLTLGTIEEAKEGSTADESEIETIYEIPEVREREREREREIQIQI